MLFIDSATNNCEAIQQTPVSHNREISYFVYDVDVHVQTPIEDMPAGNETIPTHSKYYTYIVHRSCNIF